VRWWRKYRTLYCNIAASVRNP